jgi:DNA-binding MarR family transcriptional regulator
LKEPYNQYSLLLDRTARKVKWYAQQQFKELGFDMTVDQWLVMKLTDENEALSQRELAALMYKDMPTVTRIVDILCTKGLVEREESPADRRVSILKLTEEGREKVTNSRKQVRSIRLKAWEGLNERDFDEFNRILNKIYENLT